LIKNEILEEDLKHIITHTSAVWSRAKRKNIFLTGGTGFFGKWLMESFIRANRQFELDAELHVLSRNPNTFLQKYPDFADEENVVFHQGDVRNFDYPDFEIDYIIHAATDTDDQLIKEDPILILDTILEGTRRVLEFARVRGAGRLLFISSGAVYGKQPPGLTHVSEAYSGGPDLADPGSSYGEAKRLAELLCRIYSNQHPVETTIARCFTFVGPYLNLDIRFAIGNFIRDGLDGKRIQVHGDGTPYRSYLYMADLAIWLWTILFRGTSGKAYNVGSDEEINIAELAKKVRDFFPDSPEVSISKKPASQNPSSYYVPDISQANRELDLKCWIDLDESIRRTIHFFRGI